MPNSTREGTSVDFSPKLAHHPDVVAASTTTVGVWMRACLWSGQHRTAGTIPTRQLRTITPRPHSCRGIDRLLRHDPATDTWHITHWGELARPSGHYRAKIPATTRRAVYDRDGHQCVRCQATEHLTLDHVIPWSLGGSDDEDNLQTLCMGCNREKGATVA